VGLGTFTAPSTLARTTIFSSSNGGSIVTFPAGTKDVFISPPASGVVTTEAIQTISNKRINPRIVSVTSAGTITPTGDTADQYNVTALATAATIAAPSGTPVDGQRLTLRFEDDGTGRALTWTTSSGAYRAVGVTLPTTTVATKVTYVGCIYNSQDVFWDVVAVATQA